MTWQESHLRLVRIGEQSARFRDLTLTFTQDDQPVESVIWLPNGGGKSSMISLRSSVVLPNARDFTGAGREDGGEKRPRRLDDYVGSGDTSHTVIAWTADDPQSLFGAPKRLLTGAVYEWPSRQRPGTDGEGSLNKIWWSAVPVPGVLDIDELPVRGASLLTLGQFRAKMIELNTEHPRLQVQFCHSQSDWEKHLSGLQIDTQLARYQAKMNNSEGGIARVFKFNSTQDFINLVVYVICPPQDALDVSNVLNAHAANLFRRPKLLAEQTFLNQAAEVLTDLNTWQQLVEESTAGANTARASARAVRRSLHLRRLDLEAQADLATRRAAHHGEEETEANRARRRIDRQRTELRRLAANARASDAGRALECARAVEMDRRRTVALWSVAQHLAAQRAQRAQAAEVLELLKPERSARADLRARHDVHAHALRCLLARQADKYDDDERVARDLRDAARAATERLRPALTSAGEQLRSAQRQQAQAQARIDSHLEARAHAVQDAILRDGEEPADAVARHTEAADAARAQAATLMAAASSRRDIAKELSATANKDGRRYSTLEAEISHLSSAVDALVRRRDELAANPRLAALAESDDVDPWTDAPRLRAALTEAIRDSRSRALAQAVEAASDDRLVASADSDGYLPTPLAARAAIDALKNAGVTAESGWDVLTRGFPGPARAQAAAERPDIVSGVVVQSEGVRTRALAVLASSPALELVPLVTYDELAAAADGTAGPASLPTVPLNAGLHDRDAAALTAQSLRDASDARTRERQRLTEQADTDVALLNVLTTFLDEFPSSDSLEAARQSVRSHQRTLEELADAIAGILKAAEQADSRAAALAQQASDQSTDAAAHDRDATAAKRLADAAEAQKQHLDSLTSGTASIAKLEPFIADLSAALNEAFSSASAHELTRQHAARLAAEVRSTRTRITVLDELTPPPLEEIDAVAAAGATDVEARFTALHQQWETLSSSSVLEERLRNVETAAESAGAAAEREVGLFDGDKDALRADAHRVALEHDSTGVEAALRGLRHELEAQLVLVTQASNAHDATTTALRVANEAVERAGRIGVDETVHFTSAEQAEADATTLDLEHSAAQSRESAAREGEQAQKARAKELTDQAKHLDYLTTTLHVTTSDDEPGSVESFAGSVPDDANALVEGTNANLTRAQQELEKAERGRRDAAVTAVRMAGRPAYQNLTLTIRDRLLEGDPLTLGKLSATYTEEVNTRLKQLEDLVTQVEKDKDRVTTVVAARARELLNGIAGAARASVLPADLGEMSGNQFLTIRFDSPTDEELSSRVSQEILSMLDNAGANARNLPTGEETLRKCVHAAVGNRRFTVNVLKPNEHMIAQRVPVVDVARFSDGEKLTTCVLLFCAFARMRRRGNSAGTATGTLMLDNPFGQASNAQLVALQLAVAKAQQVHLVYATGLEDMGALAQFRGLIRLRNRKVAGGDGFVQTEDRRRTGEVTAVAVARPDAPAATWQPQEARA